ncbi:MAG: RDD family protein [Candidatus Thorarchaeota archaeon]
MALLADSCIVGGLIYVICIGWLYQIGKDYLREGQSFGKGIMGLRVIDFHTGMPATISQSFIHNRLCGCVDASCCCLAAMIDEDGRRIGDHVAGTVVIRDQ